jgi:kynurenine 3-monooxygenase
MLPYYGQGANAGFEDCEMLDCFVEQHGTDWESVFRDFETARKRDTDAMADLCHKHLDVLRHDVSRTDYQEQWALEQQLHRLMPDVFTPLYSMIAFSSTPYAEARRRDGIEPDIWGQLKDPALSASLCQRVRSRLSAAHRLALTAPPPESDASTFATPA